MIKINFNFLKLCCALMLLSYSVNAQVGIGTTDPKSRLDIVASNPENPFPTDGLLVPRINKFPSKLPGKDQEGMLFYLKKTDGENPPGFYFWKEDLTTWIPFNKTKNTLESQWAVGTTSDGRNYIYAINAKENGKDIEAYDNGDFKIESLAQKNNPSLLYPANVVASANGTLQVSKSATSNNSAAGYNRNIKVITADYDQNNRNYNTNYVLNLAEYDPEVSVFILRKSKSYVQALVNFAGISGGVDGRIITIMNTEKQFRFQFTPQNYSTAAENRFDINQNLNMEAEGYHSATFIYDGSSSKWILLDKIEGVER